MVATQSHDGRLTSLSRPSLRDIAVRELRNAITIGTLKPGQHLIETKLSDELGISRGTLREAMRQLQQEGLVVQDARGRTHVPELSPELIRETFQVRISLEVMAAFLIMTQSDQQPILARLHERLDALAASADESVAANVDADLNLHREICLSSGNAVLLSHWESLAAILRMSILHAGVPQARANMAAERHRPLLAVIENGSFTEVWNVFREHNEQALEHILSSEALRQAGSAEDSPAGRGSELPRL